MNRNTMLTACTVLALVWLGLLLGISFLATPVKFMAPSLSLPVALDVGRHTFLVSSRVEVVLAGLLVLGTFGSRRRDLLVPAVALTAVVATQVLWLLPVLDARVEVILQGGTPPPSNLHQIYIMADGVKLILLGLLALFALRAAPSSQEE